MRVVITILVSVVLCSCASHPPVRDMSGHPAISFMSAGDLAWIAGADARPMDGADPTWITNADAGRLAVELLSNRGYTNATCSGMSIGAEDDYYCIAIEGKTLGVVRVDRKSKRAEITLWTPLAKKLRAR
jgi:hypothetical protein